MSMFASLFRLKYSASWRRLVASGAVASLMVVAVTAEAATASRRSHQPVPTKTKAVVKVSPSKVTASRAHVSKAPAGKVVASKAVPASRLKRVVAIPERPSFGQAAGLRSAGDELALKSSVALVMDQDTSEVLFSKNPQAVLPIASLTKLMTALVVIEARQSLDDEMEISVDDIDTEKGSRSRLAVGTRLSRGEALHLALMASENRAAHALGRYYPGGLVPFVAAMNRKAEQLGMRDTHYYEPTGLSSHNQSSAPDLARLVKAAYDFPLIRELSTSPEYAVEVGRRTVQFHNTNGLVRNPAWDIGLQKTGYIVEAGRCLVMQAKLAGRKLIMVFLDSTGKYSRIGDAERVRHWIETGAATASTAPRVYLTPAAARAAAGKPML